MSNEIREFTEFKSKFTLRIQKKLEGVLSLEDNSGVLYSTSAVHKVEADSGILWNSFDFNWRCEKLIISKRDQEHIALNQFESPFL